MPIVDIFAISKYPTIAFSLKFFYKKKTIYFWIIIFSSDINNLHTPWDEVFIGKSFGFWNIFEQQIYVWKLAYEYLVQINFINLLFSNEMQKKNISQQNKNDS